MGTNVDEWDHGVMRGFIRRRGAATPRSHVRGHPIRPPVLVGYPDVKLLALAISRARRSAICVLEGPTMPLSGWAMECGALNLTTGVVTEDLRTPEQRKELENLAFQGNNGWGSSYDDIRVPKMLRLLIEEGATLTVILGTMMARGASEDGIKHLTGHFAALPPAA